LANNEKKETIENENSKADKKSEKKGVKYEV
jgi:hypothetical protein